MKMMTSLLIIMVENNNSLNKSQNPNTNNKTSNNNSGKQPNNVQPQQQGNVIRPEQSNLVNNSTKTPQSNQVSSESKQPQKTQQNPPADVKKEENMSAFEKRFRGFVKHRFGGMIGETLLGTELQRNNVQDMSLLDEQKQIEIMEKIIDDVFREHNMPQARDQTKIELKLQLALDKTIETLKEIYSSVEIEYINLEHNNSELLNVYSSETEKAWCTFGESKGTVNSKIYLFTPERETMMQITDYAKKKNIDFNPLDEEQKSATLFGFYKCIIDSFLSSLKGIIHFNTEYSLSSTSRSSLDLVEDIREEITAQEKNKGSRVDVISVDCTFEIERQPFHLRVFMCI